LHALGLSESSLNSYDKRLQAKRESDELYEHDLKELPATASDNRKHDLKLDILKRSFSVQRAECRV
jgi:hypothetical protein